MTKVDAIVLAGARNDGKLMDVSDEAWEALISLDGQPMIRYVLDALAETVSVKRIVVVGPTDALLEMQHLYSKPIEFVQAKGKMMDNLSLGADQVKDGERVLIVTSDIPLITAKAIDDFVTSCQSEEADIYYPIIPKALSEARFPGARRTYVPLKEGVFTGGNLALIRPEVIPACRHMISQAIAMRKNPLKLSRLLGFKFIFKLLFKQLRLAEIEARVHDVLGFKGVGMVTDYPEIGIDVDKPEDYDAIIQHFRTGTSDDHGGGATRVK